MFCDIVDSTGLSERHDPEDLREILLDYQTICSQCIKNAGGNVVTYVGDGIRAEFGYPLASENEAESAVRAGLALLRDIKQLAERSVATIQEMLRIRIGLHTGVAVIGKAVQGHEHNATEIVGETLNIAARLQEIGEPNSLVISGETRHLLRGKFPLRPLGARALKGLSRKIEIFEVVGEAMQDDTARGERHHNASPLVGRLAELDRLLHEWELAKSGHGHTVEIIGEPGIGKSRLALELIDKTDLCDDSISVLQASAQHQNTPLYPIIRSLEQKIGIRKDESVEAKSARLHEFLAGMSFGGEEQHVLIGRLLGLPTPREAVATAPDAQELRRKTRDIVVQLLTSHVDGGNGLILVEDFHWADPSTVEVVERIADQIRNAPILLVITSRTDTIRGGSVMIQRIPLQRLADSECRNLAGSLVRNKQLPSRLFEEIVARSDGVPLFVEELAAAALETGQVDHRAGAGSVAGGHGVPPALYDSLMLRLDCLGEAKAIAQLASVIGRSFSHQLLSVVASEDGHAFEPALARLLESGLIRVEDNDHETVYSFKHALVRDVAYQSLLKRERRELHGRVFDQIENHLPEIAKREPDYLAHHLSEAGRSLRAVHMWLQSAKQSAERSANLEAFAQLRRALEEIKKLPVGLERDNLELNAQIALIGPTIALQGFAAAVEMSGRAIELCRAMNDDPRIFPALYARWSYLRVAGNAHEALALAQDFLTLAEQRGTRIDRMVGHRLLGTSLLEGNAAKAREHLERASNLYDDTTDRVTAVIYGTDVQVTSLSNLCLANWLLGRRSEALTHGRRALELARQLQHTHTLGYAFAHLCMLYTLEREVQTVETLAQQALGAAIKRELPLWVSVARTFLGWSEIQSGRLAEGIDTLEKQCHFLQTVQLVFLLPIYLCWLAEAYISTGKMTEAKRCVDQAHDVTGQGGNSWYHVECLRIKGRLAAHPKIDDAAQAENCFEQALSLARQRGQPGFALRAAHDLASHLAAKGQPERARKLLQDQLPIFINQPDRGDLADAKALLRSLQG
jgi:class 3 adenylate cyclase/tetratricopeptide (TPR) repeat protein